MTKKISIAAAPVRTLALALVAALLALPAAADAAFPGARGKLAFTRNFTAIFAIDSDGTGLARLTDPPLGKEDFQPAWAPDGRRVAFTSTRDNTNPVLADQEIYAVYADGSGLTRVTNDPAQDNVHPSWSPDGRHIAYSTFTDIYVTNADGSGAPTNLTNTHDLDGHPAWSPDGARIAFESQRGADTEIIVMNVDGSGPWLELTNSPEFETQPEWSPDGSRIAFVRDGDIFLVDADGTGAETPLTSGTNVDSDPAWSPDGRQIAFARDDDLFVTDATGTGPPSPVTSTPTVSETEPDWQPLTTTITVENALTPSTAPARFDLLVDANIARTAAGDGDAGTTVVDPGVHTVDATSLPDYASSIRCTKNGAPDVAGPGSSIDVEVAARDTEVCTVAHTQGAATPTGSGASVSPPDVTTGSHPVTITFADVTAGGVTTLSSSGTGPAVPSGFEIDGVYYELTSTAAFTTATVCFSYTGSPPSILHWVSGVPHVDSSPVDTGSMVCTEVSSFSPFALAHPVGDTEAPQEVACGAADGAWHAGNVDIACTAEDTRSGLADPADATFSLSTSVPAGAENADAATGPRQVCDVAGNCATAGPIGANKVDRRAPTLLLPTAKTVDATSPQGATVTFSASAADGADRTQT